MADDINPITPGADDVAADAAEDASWEKAINEFVGDRATTTETTTEETTQDEQADTTTTTTTETTTQPETTTTTTTIDPNETAEQKAEREKLEADTAAKADAGDDEGEESDDSKQARRSTRRSVREVEQEREVITAKVIEQLYPDRVAELRDGQDKPIKTIEDVMSYINPLTKTEENPDGRNFTEDEAATWLMNAQQDFNKQIEADNKIAAEVAEVQIDLADQIESMDFEYEALFKEMPDLRDQLIKQYGKTLTRDAKSGIVTGMPLSLEEFAETQLQPYVKLAESLEAQKAEKEAADKAIADAKKKLNRVDRSDIFGHDTTDDDMDDEDKGWDKALKSYYGK